MDIQSAKIELARLILDLESPSLILKIRDLLKAETQDFANSLTDSEKTEIQLAI